MFSLLMGPTELASAQSPYSYRTCSRQNTKEGGTTAELLSADNDFRHWGVVLSKPYDHAPAVRAAKRR
jgi:hypothetical protein